MGVPNLTWHRQQAERMDGIALKQKETDRIHRCHGPRLGFREGDPIMDGRMEESIAEFLCRYWQAVKVAEAGTVRDWLQTRYSDQPRELLNFGPWRFRLCMPSDAAVGWCGSERGNWRSGESTGAAWRCSGRLSGNVCSELCLLNVISWCLSVTYCFMVTCSTAHCNYTQQ